MGRGRRIGIEKMSWGLVLKESQTPIVSYWNKVHFKQREPIKHKPGDESIKCFLEVTSGCYMAGILSMYMVSWKETGKRGTA